MAWEKGEGLCEKGGNLLDILHRLGDCLPGRLEAGSWGAAVKALIQND